MGHALRAVHAPEVNDQAEDVELLDTPASKVKRRKTTWLWGERLEMGTVAIVQGDKSVGKSTWLRTIAAAVSGGPPIPGTKGKQRITGGVLYYAGEESLETKVSPGLEAAGADMDRCYLSDCMADDPALQLQLPGDCERLLKRVTYRAAKLVIIDPIFNFSDGSCDLDGPTVPARQFMRALGRVAASTGCLILFSRNLTKNRSLGALAAGRGGAELGNAARSVLHLQRLPDDPATCALSVAACNAGRPVPTLTYRLEGGKNGQPVIVLTGESTVTADELCAGEEGELERCMLERAKSLIRSMIPSGKLDSRIVKQKADNSMISIRTLQSAAKQLGVRVSREGSRETTCTYWSPPAKGWGG